MKVKGYGVFTPESTEILAPGVPHFNGFGNELTQYFSPVPKHSLNDFFRHYAFYFEQ